MILLFEYEKIWWVKAPSGLLHQKIDELNRDFYNLYLEKLNKKVLIVI